MGRVSLLAAVLLLLIACDPPEGQEGAAGPGRTFALGFTPFPYDISREAVDFTYRTIARDADLIAHHFDEGIPWPEALAGEPFHRHVRNDWEDRKRQTPSDHEVYVAITPISIGREGLAPYRGAKDDMPLPTPWDGYAFDHPAVMRAYVAYATRVVEFFRPDHLAIGIEVNLLLNNAPQTWEAYLRLQAHTYAVLEQRYPKLPVFATVFGMSLLDGYRGEDDHEAQMRALPRILEHSDYYALSLYPYMTKYMTSALPASMWDDLLSLSGKPVVIAESGYPADAFEITPAGVGRLRFEGTPEKQKAFLEAMLAQAERRRFRFIVNYVLRDYDPLWEKIGRTDIAAVWRDTGFYDESGKERPALRVWRQALGRRRGTSVAR